MSPSAEPGRSGVTPVIGTRVGIATLFEIGSWPGTSPGWTVGLEAGAAAAAVVGALVGLAAAVVGFATAVVGAGGVVGAAAGGAVVGAGALDGPQASNSARPPSAKAPAARRSTARRLRSERVIPRMVPAPLLVRARLGEYRVKGLIERGHGLDLDQRIWRGELADAD